MGHDPDPKSMPKSLASKRIADQMGKFEFQGPSTGQDEIHIHDRTNPIVFIWEGGRSFRIAWQEVLSIRGQLEVGEMLAMIGSTDDPGNGRKAGVMVFEKMGDGSLEMTIEEYDKDQVYELEVRKSLLLEWIDDWVERKC